MSKLRELVEARRAELIEELRECDAFLGLPGSLPIEDASVPVQGLTNEQLQAILAASQHQALAPMARPRSVPDSTVLERALAAPARPGVNGIPTVNPNDRLVTDPKTGSVVRIPNGANQ